MAILDQEQSAHQPQIMKASCALTGRCVPLDAWPFLFRQGHQFKTTRANYRCF
jgi:hypothetical protein